MNKEKKVGGYDYLNDIVQWQLKHGNQKYSENVLKEFNNYKKKTKHDK